MLTQKDRVNLLDLARLVIDTAQNCKKIATIARDLTQDAIEFTDDANECKKAEDYEAFARDHRLWAGWLLKKVEQSSGRDFANGKPHKPSATNLYRNTGQK